MLNCHMSWWCFKFSAKSTQELISSSDWISAKDDFDDEDGLTEYKQAEGKTHKALQL